MQGLHIEQYYPELGHGQHELSIGHAPALQAADRHVLYRETLRGVANKLGLIASLAPKPFVAQAGNGCHLHLVESPDQPKRQEWIAALDKMESLKPRAVIAGHKRVGNEDSPRIIGETRKYIRDFERLAMRTTTARATVG